MKLSRTFRKLWDVPKENVLPGLVLLSVLFMAGAITGQMITAYIGNSGDEELRRYIEGYLTLSEKGMTMAPAVWTVFITFYRYHLIAFLLGFTSLGIVAIPALTAMRGFFLSFAVSCFVKLFGSHGILLAVVVFGMQCIVTLPCYFIIAIQAFSASCLLAAMSFGHGKRATATLYGKGYFLRCGICAVVLFVGVFVDIIITPWILSFLAGRF